MALASFSDKSSHCYGSHAGKRTFFTLTPSAQENHRHKASMCTVPISYKPYALNSRSNNTANFLLIYLIAWPKLWHSRSSQPIIVLKIIIGAISVKQCVVVFNVRECSRVFKIYATPSRLNRSHPG